MSKLIFADIPMVFKSKMLYIIFGLSAFLGFSIVLISYPETETPEELLALLYYNSSNFINMLMPILFGGVSIILISKEFSSGVIRNKVTMGHSRRNIILSWTWLSFHFHHKNNIENHAYARKCLFFQFHFLN